MNPPGLRVWDLEFGGLEFGALRFEVWGLRSHLNPKPKALNPKP